MGKIAICAGKTGGHFFPALAVARFLKAKDSSNKILFVGTRGGLDEKIMKEEKFDFFGISGSGLPTRAGWGTLKWAFNLLLSLGQVRKFFKAQKPDAVLSFGGYISCAPVLMARWMGIPVVIHESNITPGRANRFLARFANAVCTSFPIDWSPVSGLRFPEKKSPVTSHQSPVVVTGLPIREKFLSVDRPKAIQHFGLDPNKVSVLVMGGSLGSRKINECLQEALKELKDLTDRIQIIHVTGKDDYNRVMRQYHPNGLSYHPYSFLQDIEYAFHAADLFVGRSGASTLAEITLCGLPSVLIPYPYAIENHQRSNANFLKRQGASEMLEESHLTGLSLAKVLRKLISDVPLRKLMSNNAIKLGVPDGTMRLVNVLEGFLSP